MQGIYLSLGTNLGAREANLANAIERLEARAIRVIRTSSVYETAAWGKTNQPSFLNQVVCVDTQVAPATLLEVINAIELEMGRERFEKWGERLIDIDILYYHDQVVHSPELNIPHPEINNRRFNLVPLVEIAADFIHPVVGISQEQLLEQCTDELPVNLLVAG